MIHKLIKVNGKNFYHCSLKNKPKKSLYTKYWRNVTCKRCLKYYTKIRRWNKLKDKKE